MKDKKVHNKETKIVANESASCEATVKDGSQASKYEFRDENQKVDGISETTNPIKDKDCETSFDNCSSLVSGRIGEEIAKAKQMTCTGTFIALTRGSYCEGCENAGFLSIVLHAIHTLHDTDCFQYDVHVGTGKMRDSRYFMYFSEWSSFESYYNGMIKMKNKSVKNFSDVSGLSIITDNIKMTASLNYIEPDRYADLLAGCVSISQAYSKANDAAMADSEPEPTIFRPLQVPNQFMELNTTQFWLKDSGETISKSVKCGGVEHSNPTKDEFPSDYKREAFQNRHMPTYVMMISILNQAGKEDDLRTHLNEYKRHSTQKEGCISLEVYSKVFLSDIVDPTQNFRGKTVDESGERFLVHGIFHTEDDIYKHLATEYSVFATSCSSLVERRPEISTWKRADFPVIEQSRT